MLGIKDNAVLCGRDYEQFKAENKELADATKVTIFNGRDITFLSLCEVPEYQEEGATVFWVISDAALREFRKYNRSLKLAKLYNKDYPAEALAEMKETTRLMLFANDEKYMISEMALPTLSMQASVAGNMTLNRNNTLRDMHLADALFYKNEAVTAVYREIEVDGIPVKKILAVFAGAYREIKQTIVSDIADSLMSDEVMGDAKVDNWLIDHEITKVEMSYPQISGDYSREYGVKELTPGVMIRTSDVGKSAITVFGTMRVRRSYVITEEISAKHTKKNENPEKIIETVKEKIFFDHKKLPEQLATLIGTEAVDYDTLPMDQANDKVCEIVEESIEKLLKGVLSKRQLQSLTDAAKSEMCAGIRYTLYDIALMLMELSERINGLDESTMMYVRKALAKTPEVLNTVMKESGLYLTA